MKKTYKDIVNFSLITSLRTKLNDACLMFNKMIKSNNIDNRESEFYEVYTEQYKKDIDSLIVIRDASQKIADECNRILLDLNTYHIKQYYINKEELSEYKDLEEYNKQEFKEEKQPIVETVIKEEITNDEEDIW